MANNGTTFPRFFSIHTVASSLRNKMELPDHFLSLHGEDIPKKVKFIFSDGTETSLIYKQRKKKFYGIAGLFSSLQLGDEWCTICEYLGQGNFLVYVFNEKFVDVRHSCTGFIGMGEYHDEDVDWFFISICQNATACDRGLIKVPPGHDLPSELRFSLPNGQVFHASYMVNDQMIVGLRIFLLHDVLMLTYRGNGGFDLVLFDNSTVEKTFSSYSQRVGAMVGISWGQFKIEIQPFHLYQYCHGIDISADFKEITDKWNVGEYITVYHEGNYFFLEIRQSGRRWKLHSGWIRFSQLLNLAVGDVLVFDMTTPPLGFSLHVYRFDRRND